MDKTTEMPLDEALTKARTYAADERHKDIPSVSRTLALEIDRLRQRLVEAHLWMTHYADCKCHVLDGGGNRCSCTCGLSAWLGSGEGGTKMTKLLDALRDACEKATFALGYEIDSDGNAWSLRSNWRGHGQRILAPYPNSHGYLRIRYTVNGTRKSAFLHKLVAVAFRGPKPTPSHEVRHMNGIRTDNKLSNIQWGTRSENAIDRQKHGTDKAAENGRKSAHKLRGRRRAALARLDELQKGRTS